MNLVSVSRLYYLGPRGAAPAPPRPIAPRRHDRYAPAGSPPPFSIDPTMDLQARLQESLAAAYLIERELGGGGMSRVFLAEEKALARQVVVKVLSPNLIGDLDMGRFAREIMLAARLQQANIVPVLTAGTTDELPYYTMPFVDGATLRERMASGPIPIREGIAILRDVTRALAYAHARGVVHRDIKPENVLLSGGAAVVTDFGIAKAVEQALGRPADDAPLSDGIAGEPATNEFVTMLTQHGTSLGTPAYMSPEQTSADPDIDHRADLYALGMTAYEMFAGAHPFDGKRGVALLAAHFTQVIPPLNERRADAPAALCALIMRCLAKEQNDRPSTTAEVLDTLNGIAVTSATADDGRPSVAVLPLVNISGDPDNEFFSDGMTEEILGTLAHMPRIRMAARTSCLAMKGSKDDLRAIADRLGVGAILGGSVRKSGDRVRIAVQLTRVADASVLWAERFDRSLTDIFAVQDEIAHAIGNTLAETLGASESPGARNRPAGPVNAEAYEQFLRGRAYLEMRDMDMPRAIERFERAIGLDPSLSGAHAWLAYSFLNLGYYCAMPSSMAFTRARELAERALEINPSEAIALTVRGAVANWYEWNPDEGERLARRAFEMAPGLVECRSQLMYILMARGRLDEALAFAEEGRKLDPLSRVPQIDRAEILLAVGRLDESLAAFEAVMTRNPEHPLANYWAGVINVRLGRPDDALRFAERFASLGRHPHSVGVMASAHAVAGRTDEARRLLDEIVRRSETEYVAPVLIASVHRWLGEHDAMYEWLERAIDARDWWLGRLQIEPWFTEFRNDARFKSILARVGIAS
jgi:eukaryotic-like serine/threonine-protein kinase